MEETLFMRPIPTAAAVLALFATAPLAAQDSSSTAGQRWGDHVQTRSSTRVQNRVTTERPRVSPRVNPQPGPEMRDGYILLPDTRLENPAVSVRGR
jgi:hypothetical protein